ncbi:TolC family protein [Nemorincola caseinilytica]|uniref:TolC family protein n=1 Tax=Nemorincola caseinilytica TaxID=2054315 RepID=A0ABP8NH80_9BACT
MRYAIDHNITIRQDSLNARLARYALRQSELSQIPSLNASASYGRSFGRSINPTTNQFVESTYDFLGPSASSNVLLFGWMQVRNTIARNKYSLEAALADLDQRRDDIALNVANGYLAALLAQEQINVARSQVDLSMALLDQTRAFAGAGRLPELNVAQQESQLATDSANLINAIASYNSSILDLKTLLNLDFGEPMVLQAPEVAADDQLRITVTQPEEIFLTARSHFGSIRGNQLRVAAAEKGLAAAKSGLYPQLSLSYQVGTNFASNFQRIAGYGDTLVAPTANFLQFNNDRIPIFQYIQMPTVENTPFGDQIKNNVRQSVVLNLNVPIFNGWQTRYGVKQAQVNLASAQLAEYNAELVLKQSVYKAHNDAFNAVQRYNAARRADDAAKRALDFAKKRYDLGLTSTVDLLVTKNSEFAAASNLVGAKYQLLFRLKVIEYYQGKELKL